MLGCVILVFTLTMTLYALIDWLHEDDEFDEVRKNER